MKRILALFFVLLFILTMTACNKKVDRNLYDEGDTIDKEASSQYAEDNPGDPYAQEEIGTHRAFRNLLVACGTYDTDLESFVTYEYIKDSVHNGNPCYIFSKKTSKTQYGEYKHHCYMAVYKDGSAIADDVILQ